jgi:hypothetical protein
MPSLIAIEAATFALEVRARPETKVSKLLRLRRQNAMARGNSIPRNRNRMQVTEGHWAVPLDRTDCRSRLADVAEGQCV